MEAQKQIEIDWTRASQLAALRDAALEPRLSADGKTVSAATQKLVLRTIDDHGRGREAWMSYETLAEECCLSTRTCKRAVEVLIEASLICVELRRCGAGFVCNHYRIVWTELALCARDARPTPESAPAPPAESPTDRCAPALERSALGTDRCAPALERSALGTDRCAPGGTLNALTAIKRSASEPPPPTPSEDADASECEWAAAAGEFISRLSVARELADDARRAGSTPEQFRSELRRLFAIATSSANKPLWKVSLGGVVAYRFRVGAWPAEGVCERPDKIAECEATAASVRARRAVEQLDRDIDVAVMEGRRRRLTEDQIKAVLRKRWPDEVLVPRGW